MLVFEDGINWEVVKNYGLEIDTKWEFSRNKIEIERRIWNIDVVRWDESRMGK